MSSSRLLLPPALVSVADSRTSLLLFRFSGWNVDNIEDIYTSAFRQRFYRGGPVLMSAISGLDIALWDIKGRKLGVPIWQLMGGRVRDRVKVYG